jgi:hypothetical protein
MAGIQKFVEADVAHRIRKRAGFEEDARFRQVAEANQRAGLRGGFRLHSRRGSLISACFVSLTRDNGEMRHLEFPDHVAQDAARLLH